MIASFSGGSYLTIPLRAPFVAAVIQPASPAPKEELNGVNLFKNLFYFSSFCHFFFLFLSYNLIFSFPSQNPMALFTNLCWDPWSLWIHLTHRLTQYCRSVCYCSWQSGLLTTNGFEGFFGPETGGFCLTLDIRIEVFNIPSTGKPSLSWRRLWQAQQGSQEQMASASWSNKMLGHQLYVIST